MIKLPMVSGARDPLMIASGTEIPHIPRILALDGGGVRGLSSLLILQKLMSEILRLKGDREPPLPCQYFDLICGTSTGGLIAIMLGRLHMVRPPKIPDLQKLIWDSQSKYVSRNI
jgi:Patatin-like phospholipase